MATTDATEHGRIVLAAIIPGRRDLLDTALRKLLPEHFVDQTQELVFALLQRYVDATNAVLSRAAMGDLVRNRTSAARLLLLEEFYDLMAYTAVSDTDFIWSVEQLRELYAEAKTREALTQGMEVVRSGITDSRGELTQGHSEARNLVLQRFAEIDRDLSMQDAPEGSIRNEGVEMQDEYAKIRTDHLAGRRHGITLGIPSLDYYTGGFNPGELALLAGYSSDGKTTTCVQGAWSCAVEQGKNVVVLTTETVRAQFRRRLVARHSMLPHWQLPEGINSRNIKNGDVPDELVPHLYAIMSDLATNPGYGQIYIAQVPRGATIATCEARLYRIQRQFHIDMVYIDYLALLRATERRDSDREMLGSILRETKQMATTFDGGRGVPIASPWQVNRKAKEYADMHGMYLSEHLAETAEATNSPDIVLAQLANKDKDARVREVLMQILKNRDGETVVNAPLRVRIDFGTSAFLQAGEAVVARGLNELVQYAPPPDFLGV